MSNCRLDGYVDSEEINKFRTKEGLAPIKKKVVSCLRCKNKFESKDYPRIRLCGRCRVVSISSIIYSYE
jgi:hypothetical protein